VRSGLVGEKKLSKRKNGERSPDSYKRFHT